MEGACYNGSSPCMYTARQNTEQAATDKLNETKSELRWDWERCTAQRNGSLPLYYAAPTQIVFQPQLLKISCNFTVMRLSYRRKKPNAIYLNTVYNCF